jgi:predicted membrane-bound spermidine synthase
MGLCALATLPLFSSAFGLMQYFLTAVARTEQGYLLFNLASHALCLLLMLPTTFLAGATLPLMTCILLRRGTGERAIGAIYAFNTLGAIAGVVLAVHVLMPLTGLKGAIWAGAALDLGLGIVLLVAFVLIELLAEVASTRSTPHTTRASASSVLTDAG